MPLSVLGGGGVSQVQVFLLFSSNGIDNSGGMCGGGAI